MPKKISSTQTQKRSLAASGFYSDSHRKDMIYAKLIRSPAETGKLKDVSISELPEGYFLFTAKDIPGDKTVIINNNKVRIFGYDKITYSGEPIAIIAGPEESVVEELAGKVIINYDVENLETAFNNVISKKDNSSDISDFVEEINEMPSLNEVIDKKHSETDTEQVVNSFMIKSGIYNELPEAEADAKLFTEDAHITKSGWSQTITTPQWQETTGSFSYMEGGKLHIYAPTRWSYNLIQVISAATGLDVEKIYIHKTKSSDLNATGLWRTSILATQVALISFLTGKPAMLILSQNEQEQFIAPGVSAVFEFRSALTNKGKIKALKANISIDIGAFNPFSQELTEKLSTAAYNYYKIENLCIKATTHLSKNPPTSICIKNVDSQAFFAIENHIQKISQETQFFPDELRTENIILNDKKKEKIIAGPEPDMIKNVIAKNIKDSDFNRKYASFMMEAKRRKKTNSNLFFAIPIRGIGISTVCINSSDNALSNLSNSQKLEVTLYPEDKVVIHSIASSHGIRDIWRTTVNEILQVPKENVVIDSDFSFDEMPSVPEDALCTISTLNVLLKRCCTDIQKKRFHEPLPISSKKKFTPALNKVPVYAFASSVVEVEVDTYTYSEKIKGIWICLDCGEVLNEKTILNTIKLEIQQELTKLVSDKTVICDNIHIYLMPSNYKPAQINGLIHNTIPAAFSSALSQALSTDINNLPCTEEQLFTLVKIKESEEELKTEESHKKEKEESDENTSNN